MVERINFLNLVAILKHNRNDLDAPMCLDATMKCFDVVEKCDFQIKLDIVQQ